MRSLTPYRQDRILELGVLLESIGASEGVAITQEALAEKLGWSTVQLFRTVRTIKEHPELGIAVSFRRGPNPMVTYSSTAERLFGDSVIEVEHVSRQGRNESILRLARYANMTFAHYSDTGDKRRASAQRLLNECRSLRAALSGAQSALDGARIDEAAIAEFVDGVLARFPVAQ